VNRQDEAGELGSGNAEVGSGDGEYGSGNAEIRIMKFGMRWVEIK